MPIWMPFKEVAKHMLDINSAMEGMMEYAVTIVHAGDKGVAEDELFQKLILISLALAIEDLYT